MHTFVHTLLRKYAYINVHTITPTNIYAMIHFDTCVQYTEIFIKFTHTHLLTIVDTCTLISFFCPSSAITVVQLSW